MSGTDRLRARDLALLAAEDAGGPLHHAALEILSTGDAPLSYATLAALIERRLDLVPRYRQRLQEVPGRLANPAWIDDPDFDLAYHVRRSALPRPGTDAQLRELVARIISRPLDRSRPLWEVYVIEGLGSGEGATGGEGSAGFERSGAYAGTGETRVAVLTKSHPVLVDGSGAVDIGQVLLDPGSGPAIDSDAPTWRPATKPTGAGLIRDAVHDNLTSPATLLETTAAHTGTALRAAGDLVGRVGAVAGALTGAVLPQVVAPASPLRGRQSQQRLFTGLRTDLADYRAVRAIRGGTINDVVLATIAGGLRKWLMGRGTRAGDLGTVRAMVPLAVIDDRGHQVADQVSHRLTAYLIDLPLPVRSPAGRLREVGRAFSTHLGAQPKSGPLRTVAATRLTGLAGFAPATFHALGSRLIATQGGGHIDLGITNVPGPQQPLYAAGGRMVESYPVLSLPADHVLAIGVTSYDGSLYYGLTGDRTAVPDLDDLASCLRAELAGLVGALAGKRSPALL